MKRSGFTLIELLVVVAIIGILAAVGVVAYNGYTGAAKIAVVKSNHKLATKFIQTAVFNAELFGTVKTWDYSSKSCIQRDTFSEWFIHGSTAFGCLEIDKNHKNPFDSNDSEGAFVGNYDPPTVDQVGRTHCGWSDVRGTFTCYSRWGSGANDYETSIIEQPN